MTVRDPSPTFGVQAPDEATRARNTFQVAMIFLGAAAEE